MVHHGIGLASTTFLSLPGFSGEGDGVEGGGGAFTDRHEQTELVLSMWRPEKAR